MILVCRRIFSNSFIVISLASLLLSDQSKVRWATYVSFFFFFSLFFSTACLRLLLRVLGWGSFFFPIALCPSTSICHLHNPAFFLSSIFSSFLPLLSSVSSSFSSFRYLVLLGLSLKMVFCDGVKLACLSCIRVSRQDHRIPFKNCKYLTPLFRATVHQAATTLIDHSLKSAKKADPSASVHIAETFARPSRSTPNAPVPKVGTRRVQPNGNRCGRVCG